MSKNKNVESAVFDSTTISEPRNARIAIEYQTIEDSAGADKAISSNDPVRGRGHVQIAFADWDSSVSLLAKLRTEGDLTLTTELLGTDTVKTLTIKYARLIGVVQDMQHADASAHIATFVVRTETGAAFSITAS